jgi:hypothetical protein
MQTAALLNPKRIPKATGVDISDQYAISRDGIVKTITLRCDGHTFAALNAAYGLATGQGLWVYDKSAFLRFLIHDAYRRLQAGEVIPYAKPLKLIKPTQVEA